MKLEISVPEVVKIFKEIPEQPERLFDMVRVEMRIDGSIESVPVLAFLSPALSCIDSFVVSGYSFHGISS